MAYASTRRADFPGFGRAAAGAILSRVKQLPPELRGTAIKQALAAIDPSLVARAEAIAMTLVHDGRPPDVALEMGMSQALTDGLIGELAAVGRGAKVSSQPLLGLGAMTSLYGSGTITCKGYSWTGTGWQRTRVGQSDVPGPASNGSSCPGTAVGSGGGVTAPPKPKVQYLKVGPLYFTLSDLKPINVGWGDKNPSGIKISYSTPTYLKTSSPETKKILFDALTQKDPSSNNWTRASFAKFGHTAIIPLLQAVGIDPDVTPVYGGRMSTWDGSLVYPDAGSGTNVLLARLPIYKFKHPVTGADWGLYMALGGGQIGADPNQPSRKAYVNAKTLDFIVMPLVKPKERGWFGELVGDIVDAIDEAVHDAIDFVHDLVCSTVGASGAAGAAATINPAAGAGVAIAGSHLCGGAPQQPVQQSSGWLLPIAILAGGSALVLLLSSRK